MKQPRNFKKNWGLHSYYAPKTLQTRWDHTSLCIWLWAPIPSSSSCRGRARCCWGRNRARHPHQIRPPLRMLSSNMPLTIDQTSRTIESYYSNKIGRTKSRIQGVSRHLESSALTFPRSYLQFLHHDTPCSKSCWTQETSSLSISSADLLVVGKICDDFGWRIAWRSHTSVGAWGSMAHFQVTIYF